MVGQQRLGMLLRRWYGTRRSSQYLQPEQRTTMMTTKGGKMMGSRRETIDSGGMAAFMGRETED